MPSPLPVNVTPAGRGPDSASAGAGAPVVRTVKLNALPTTEVAAEALVMTGASLSVSVCVAPLPRSSQADRMPP